jgi:hypothetical protein
MNTYASSAGRYLSRAAILLGVVLIATTAQNASAQLFNNLQALSVRLKAGDPNVLATNSVDGPKGIAVADLNGDSKPDLALANTDGTVTLFFGIGDGNFGPPTHLQTGVEELRGIVCADLTGDGKVDVAVAAPYAGNVYLFANQGGNSFATAQTLPMWSGARNLTAGDFDGDGKQDLVVGGTTNGIRQLRGLGGGSFQTVVDLTELAGVEQDIENGFPKPVYTLETFRPTGATRDDLIATHAESSTIWVLSAPTNGVLQIQGTITNNSIHSMDTGRLLTTNGLPDLVTAHRDGDTIDIFRGNASSVHFDPTPAQTIHIAGAPRAVKVADLDRDGFNDLIIVLRNFDRVLTFKNSNGVMVGASEIPVGTSPREMVTADFNSDTYPDLAVMNRDSMDVSVLITSPGQAGFSALDQIYPVDGEVAALSVKDFNNDGRDDVMQLHRGSGEISVRLANPNGSLGEPKFYSVGNLPGGHNNSDVNNDGLPDVVAVNLGRSKIDPGSLTVRLGKPDGTFGEGTNYFLPPEILDGRFFSIAAADFDNDGDLDLAIGFFDCRIVFFRGNGHGQFTAAGSHEHLFIYEARAMVTGDFDQDGDIDIAGVGYYGGMVVAENKGDFLTGQSLTVANYGIKCCGGDGGAFAAKALDYNGDGDLDILVGSEKGMTVYLGTNGMGFYLATQSVGGIKFPTSSAATGDFDGDGDEDLAVSCKILSCITILTKSAEDNYLPALSVDVPAGEFLATGDLDGDGKTDLVGSGSVLWTALSSRRAQPAAPFKLALPRPEITGPVINELLAINNALPLDEDGGRRSDWVEIYNGATNAVSLNGCQFRLIRTNEATGWKTNLYTFPNTNDLPAKGRLVLVCSDRLRTPYHTGFNLPGEGGIVSLLDPFGNEINRVEYPVQQENISYGRFRDGNVTFTSNPFPSPGRPNADNGPVDPVVKMEGFDPATLRAGQPIRFFARASDDVGVVGVQLLYKRLDTSDPTIYRVNFYDDGLHEDGGMQDGLFSGVLTEMLPAGAEIQFYLEATDLSGKAVTVPDEAVFARIGEPITLYSLGLTTNTTMKVEISEILADNAGGFMDETGGTPDWLEVRNGSTGAVSLAGLQLAPKFFGNGGRFIFPLSSSLAPSEHRVIFCDNQPDQGDYHAPFQIDKDGDQFMLTGTGPRGSRTLISYATSPNVKKNQSYARIGFDGPWIKNVPTPNAQNVPGTWFPVTDPIEQSFTLVFPTEMNATYTIQYNDSLSTTNWNTAATIIGDGIEKRYKEYFLSERYYRVRKN